MLPLQIITDPTLTHWPNTIANHGVTPKNDTKRRIGNGGRFVQSTENLAIVWNCEADVIEERDKFVWRSVIGDTTAEHQYICMYISIYL